MAGPATGINRRQLMARHIVPLAALAVVAGACSGTPPPIHPPRVFGSARTSPVRPLAPIQEPVPTPPPTIGSDDPPIERASKLGRYMEARWPRVHLRPDANALGTIAAFGITIDYDRYGGDEGAWERSVQMVSGDLREASVELLHLSVKYFPNLKYATVWDDQRLMFFWSKGQINEMGAAWAYRDFQSYQALTRIAEIQPPLLEYAREHDTTTPSTPQ